MTNSVISTSTTSHVNLQDITKEYVEEQLKILGFEDVPPYLVEEFLQELKSGNTSALKNMGMNVKHTNDTSMLSNQDSMVSKQTHTTYVDDADDISYDEDDHLTAYTNFTQPSGHLNASDITSRRDHELQHETVMDTSIPDIPTHSLMIKSKSKKMPHDYTAEYLEKENREAPLLEATYKPPQRVRRPTSAVSRSKRPTSAMGRPTMGAKTLTRRRPLSARSSTRSINTSTISTNTKPMRRRSINHKPSKPRKTGDRCRKHDPVSRYAAMQKTWKKTGFLNRMKSGRKPLRLQVRREMREISQNTEKFGYRHIY